MFDKPMRWSETKNERLKVERRVSFEDVVKAIVDGGVLEVLEHENQNRYPHQWIMVVAFNGYVYLVPFVETAEHYFLKTIIPSRKATRQYLHKDDSCDQAQGNEG